MSDLPSIDSDQGPFGRLINVVGGYGACKLKDPVWFWHLWPVTVYHVTMRPADPLTLVLPEGVQVRTGPEFDSDYGSIPPFLQSIPGLSDDLFEWSYIFHDFARLWGGLFFREPGDLLFHYRRMTCEATDRMLYQGVGAEGGNAVVRHAIYRGVRLYAPFMKFPGRGYWDAQLSGKDGHAS